MELSKCYKLKFVIPLSLQTDGVKLLYFKLRLFDLPEFLVWYILGLRHLAANKKGLKDQSFWQRLNSFISRKSVAEAHERLNILALYKPSLGPQKFGPDRFNYFYVLWIQTN